MDYTKDYTKLEVGKVYRMVMRAPRWSVVRVVEGSAAYVCLVLWDSESPSVIGQRWWTVVEDTFEELTEEEATAFTLST